MLYKSLFFVLVSILSGNHLAAAPLSFPIGDSKPPDTASEKPVTEPLNRIVASVNDGVVLASELQTREIRVISQLQQQQAQLPPREALRKQVLDRLILENLQLQMAERSGIRVDDETLNNSLRKCPSSAKYWNRMVTIIFHFVNSSATRSPSTVFASRWWITVSK
jgi:hypothetical protein